MDTGGTETGGTDTGGTETDGTETGGMEMGGTDAGLGGGDLRARLLEAALVHVPFDGWSETTFRAAAQDAGIAPALARAACPRGAVDLALDFHARGDDAMARRLREVEQDGMRFRDRVALAVRLRIEAAGDKEVVRRSMALFALPQYAPDGARALWRTADRIWTALGDNAEDINWYTKRATLAAVHGATVLYWLGDESPDNARSWAFLDRRIAEVMEIETLKARLRDNRLLGGLLCGPLALLGRIRPPRQPAAAAGMPGSWSRRNGENRNG
ncbi:MAG: COQ9 family protein [Roseovarius sp.]